MSGAGPRSVLLAGGGTAGHVAPLLALAECLQRRDPSVEVAALGTASGLESRLVPERGLPLHEIPKVPFPRRPSAEALRLPSALRSAVAAAGAVLDRTAAEVVIGFGGYVATPAYLAARRRGVPVVVHEQNARPGLANRVGARGAAAVGITFAGTRLPRAVVTGMPLRREIATLERSAVRAEARRRFGLVDAPTVLVFGGSLGARRLNDAFGAAAAALSGAGVQVLHITGTGKVADHGPVPGAPYVAIEYCDRMDLAYAAADLAVARAGAGTVCELAAVGLPAVYVPLPIGNGEQRLNARGVVAAGGGLLVDDEAVDEAWVVDTIIPAALDDDQLQTMGAAAASTGHRDGDERLADLVLRAMRES
ncbi:MAG: undecaprenyldiphospho-muramoylpentapeptide beta-N-acetylglucosaminyltransferase [Dermatophilaceae bacterium]